MAVEAVAFVVSQKLSDMLKGESLKQNKIIVYKVEEMMKSLKLLRNSMKSRKVTKQQAQEYLHALYHMEDGIEKFTLTLVSQRKKALGFLTTHIFFFKNLNSCQKINHAMKKINTHINMLQDHVEVPTKDSSSNHKIAINPLLTSETEAEGPKELSFSYSCSQQELHFVGIRDRLQQSKLTSSFSYKEEEMGIFGLTEDVNTLVDQLTNSNSKHVVWIVGEGGIGKTTLARTIYRNRDIKHHFQYHGWVSVLEDYTTNDIMLTLLKSTDNTISKTSDLDDETAIRLKLREHLKNKRYLVILDCVSPHDIWDEIQEAFPDEKNGSKLVFTCSQTIKPTTNSHCMMPLSEDDSWNMFTKKVIDGRICEKSKRAILESCKGRPLNIVLLAGLFSMKDPSSWSRVFSFQQNNVSILSLCYNDLSDNLKVCLLYSVLFPKHFDIPVRRLLRLWVAEGFVKQQPTNIFQEDIAQTYFEELVNRKMIRISKLRSDNSPRRCRVLGVLHDYLLPKARETRLFYTSHSVVNYEDPLNVRRIVEYGTKGNGRRKAIETEKLACHSFPSYTSSFNLGGNRTKNQFALEMLKFSPPQKTQPKKFQFSPSHLRSYFSFNFERKEQIGSLLEDIINSGFGLLRVLDLEGVYKPILPQNLGKLFNLRYLGLRWTFLDTLPPSIGELTQLETLDMKHTCIDELPGSIKRLKKLRHLNLNEMCVAMQMQPYSSSNLLTLWGLILDEKVPIKNGLDKLQNLRELGIRFHLPNQDDLMDWITNLRGLRSLRLRSTDNMGRPSKLAFRSMLKLEQISHLNLLGNLGNLPDQNEFPPTLKVLTLSISLLKKDPMQTLGQLPCLTVLRLLGQSYIGKQMVCCKGGFSKLRVLKLWMLKELEEWFVEEGSMQSLKQLDVRCCDRLHSIPTTLLKQHSLEDLVLTGMPHAFTTEVQHFKSDHTSLTINHWISTTARTIQNLDHPSK